MSHAIQQNTGQSAACQQEKHSLLDNEEAIFKTGGKTVECNSKQVESLLSSKPQPIFKKAFKTLVQRTLGITKGPNSWD